MYRIRLPLERETDVQEGRQRLDGDAVLRAIEEVALTVLMSGIPLKYVETGFSGLLRPLLGCARKAFHGQWIEWRTRAWIHPTLRLRLRSRGRRKTRRRRRRRRSGKIVFTLLAAWRDLLSAHFPSSPTSLYPALPISKRCGSNGMQTFCVERF